MLKNDEYEIEVEAAKALAGWKAVFAEQVSEQAKTLARAGGKSGVITLAHYCEAATIALPSLSIAIQDSDTRNARQKAA